MSPYKHLLRKISLIGVLTGLLVWFGQSPFEIDVAHAQAIGTIAELQRNVSRVVSFAIHGFNFLSWILFTYLRFLLDPDFIFGVNPETGASPLLTVLQNLWRFSRDMMNVIFAVGIVGAALYTIVTANKDFIAEHAKKFILAVVLVNFSWFFPRVVLDIANVTTATIYGIPSLMETTECRFLDRENRLQPCKVVTDVQFFPGLNRPEAERQRVVDAYVAGGYECLRPPFQQLLCYKQEEMNNETISGQSAVLNGLIINHARMGQLVNTFRPIGDGEPRSIEASLTFLIRQIILLIIHIALLFPLLAMTVAFFIRIPVLWLTIAAMPFMFLGWVTTDQINQGWPQKIFSTFLKAAFLPAVVAVPLVVGFVLINAGSAIPAADVGGLGNIPIPLLDQIGNFWSLLWLLISLAVMYKGTFMVLSEHSVFGAEIIGKIGSFGSELGKLAANLPLSIPLPGTGSGAPGDRGISARGAMNVLNPRNINAMFASGASLPETIERLRSRDTAGEARDVSLTINAVVNDGTRRSAARTAATDIGRAATPAATETALTALIARLEEGRVSSGSRMLPINRANIADILTRIAADPRASRELGIDRALADRVRALPPVTSPPPATPPVTP